MLASLSQRLSELAGVRARAPDPPPLYWESSHQDPKRAKERGRRTSGIVDDMYPVPEEERDLLERLMNETSGDPDKAFSLVRVMRVENTALWNDYQRKRAKMRRKRGPCRFAGRGPPLTVEALADLDDSGSSTSSLDLGICEAYLWHGTRPQLAMKIVEGGFQVDHHSSAGKRFGAGGYFTEDPAKADVYAMPGEGVYQDCYAMLLCRVALGRQFRTDAYRLEGASDQARGRHDSTLAEPRGTSNREFVALSNEQVYPEYALVYERRPPLLPKEKSNILRYWGDVGADTVVGDLPAYWLNARSNGFFHETCPADEHMKPIIQALMDSTWTQAFTCDRKGYDGLHVEDGDPKHDVPEGLHVLKVLRVEDSEMWAEYVQARDDIRASRGDCTSLKVMELQTWQELPLREQRRLASDVNEVYLWHGSSPQAVRSISEGGLPVRMDGEAHGMFGDGACFADSAAKADERSEDDSEGFYVGEYAMLLCRVVLGQIQVLQNADPGAHVNTGPGRDFDSTLGQREAIGGLLRELVVPTRAQIYPEYAIIYERKYKTPRAR